MKIRSIGAAALITTALFAVTAGPSFATDSSDPPVTEASAPTEAPTTTAEVPVTSIRLVRASCLAGVGAGLRISLYNPTDVSYTVAYDGVIDHAYSVTVPANTLDQRVIRWNDPLNVHTYSVAFSDGDVQAGTFPGPCPVTTPVPTTVAPTTTTTTPVTTPPTTVDATGQTPNPFQSMSLGCDRATIILTGEYTLSITVDGVPAQFTDTAGSVVVMFPDSTTAHVVHVVVSSPAPSFDITRTSTPCPAPTTVGNAAPVPTVPAAPTLTALPSTGSTSTSLVVFASVLLAAGITVTVIARRRAA